MIALTVIGCCLSAVCIILYSLYELRDVTIFNSFVVTVILIFVSMFAGAGMIAIGTVGIIDEKYQIKKDVFIEEADIVTVFDLDFVLHEIDPNDKEKIKEYTKLIKHMDEPVLFYSKENRYVYEIESGELKPYYINDKSTFYENNNIVLK